MTGASRARRPWWRSAVYYQVYPRSFADSDSDGEGDLRGVVERIPYLASLGVDALWLSPFYPSGGVDGGYDVVDHCDVDPRFGRLADLDAVVATAHGAGLRVIIDLVPNHCSETHRWFAAAVAAGRDSPQRARFHFADGRGPGGDEPPCNWRSVFGGPSWTRVVEPDGAPGQWYYHLFAPEQPDFDWAHPAVLAEFERIMRFWLDRGVDGFRVDAADALVKDTTWPDTEDGSPVIPKDASSPVHEVYRALREVLDEYDGDRMAVVELGAPDDVVALFLRRDEMHLAFNFRLLKAPWRSAEIREAVSSSIATNVLVGAPTTWVTDNHDNVRSVSRYATDVRLEGDYVPEAAAADDAGDSSGRDPGAVDLSLGTRRARAAALLLLTLPGAAFIYAGQELGLPNVDDLPDAVLRDPVFFLTGGRVRGRDGCRVPIPWSGVAPPFGFTADGVVPWLPMPASWVGLTVAAQDADPSSMLSLYRRALTLRRAATSADDGPDLAVVVNFGAHPRPLPAGEVLLASTDDPLVDGMLPPDTAVIVAKA